ncbi:hypothetical protein ASD04_15670 [Devosia sp. Root436]|uniref:hypothetical protein n=1 Tax=Devosia sp. Root436 TaxID=1736537 RepID=UPI0006FC7A60|nr:hypothetical protein [Devosia sp. Root436]KQX34826.1 hypothetical protein ASD04_15670 [Devosia sp. Root436]
MALRAYVEEFDELAASMPAAPNVVAANDIGGVPSRELIKSLEKIDRLMVEWRNHTITTIHNFRASLLAAQKAGNDEAIRYVCNDILPLIVSKVAEVCQMVDEWQYLSPEAELALARGAARSKADRGFAKFFRKRRYAIMSTNLDRARRLRHSAQSLIWEFDPEARERTGTLSSIGDLEDYFNGLAAE